MEDFNKVIRELQMYIGMDRPTSQTEVLESLCHLAQYPNYVSGTLADAIESEIRSNLEYYKKHTHVESQNTTICGNVLIWDV